MSVEEEVKDEELREGDMVYVFGWKRIVKIKPYDGPLKDIVFALADTVPGVGFSLCFGSYTTRVKR